MARARSRSTGRAEPIVALLVAVALLGGAFLLPGFARGATYPDLTGAVNGPPLLGMGGKGTYTITAAGGPAEAANGTQVGIYSYKASISAANTSGGLISPISGVLVNGSVSVTLNAPNVSEPLTIFVLLTSGYNGKNVTLNVSTLVQIVQPYRLQTTITVTGAASVAAFALGVLLDGASVGSIPVPTLTAGASYPVSFSYVTSGLSPGYHTFSISLVQEHGLVTFAGGSEQFSTTFYVPAPSTDYVPWYLAGTSAFLGAILILTMRLGARRRGRTKK